MSSDFHDIYVGTYTNEEAEGIYRIRLDVSTGRLESLGLAAQVFNPFYVTADSTSGTLYSSIVCETFGGHTCGAVSSFSIDPADGSLTEHDRQSARGTVPCYLSLTPGGRHLLVANYGDGSLAVLPADANGRLEAATCVIQHKGSSINESRQEGPHVHSIVLSPDGRHAYAADLGIDRVMIYALDPDTGTLSSADPASVATAPGAGPRHLKFDAAGTHAYLINELDNTLGSYSCDPATGALTELQGISALPGDFAGESFCADVQLHPSGRFLYGSNRGHDSIVSATIRPDGTLAGIAHTPSGGAWPWNLAISPDGSWLLAANQRGDCVTSFAIDLESGILSSTGHLAEIPRPVCLSIL